MIRWSSNPGGMRSGIGSSRPRHNDAGSPSRNPGRSRERKGSGQAPRRQRGNSAEVAQADLYQRRANGPKEPRSTVLSPEDEAVIAAFRRHTLLPLDDCLYALQLSFPHLTRSSLHRCLQR